MNTRNILIAVISVVIAGFTQVRNVESRVFSVLNVGQGDSSVLIYDDFVMVVDTGYDMQAIWELDEVLPRDNREIDVLVITHPHFDHYGGVLQILERYKVGEIWISKACEDEYWWLNREVRLVTAGESYRYEGVDIKVLSPDGDVLCRGSGKVINDASVVLSVNVGDKKILLMGDAESEVEKSLDWSKVDILKVGHHCSDTSSGIGFIDNVRPEIAICSVGENSYGHPSTIVLDRYKSISSKVYRTDLDGRFVYQLE